MLELNNKFAESITMFHQTVNDMLAWEADMRRVGIEIRDELAARLNASMQQTKGRPAQLGDVAWDFYRDKSYRFTETGWLVYVETGR